MPFKLEPSDTLNTILLIITPLMITIIGAYIRGIMKRIDRIEELEKKQLELQMRIGSLDSIKAEWSEVKLQITRLMVQMEGTKDQKEDITVVKRDMTTIWKSIDRLKDNMFDVQQRMGMEE